MSIARHLDTLGVYQAMAVRVVPVDGEPEDLVGEGGGLADAFDRVGQRPLVGVLRDARVSAVLLGDGDLSIELGRVGGQGRMKVAWGGRVVVDETVDIPPAFALETGPFFRPLPTAEVSDVKSALHEPGRALYAVEDVGGQVRYYTDGLHGRGAGELPLRGVIPAVDASNFGSAAFREAHSVRQAYIAGEMAGGIGSVQMVVAMARDGMLGFFGAGGLPVEAVERSLQEIAVEMPPGRSWGVNLLNNPTEPDVEERTVDLYLRAGARRVSASAYMELSPAVVRYRLTGIRALPDGTIDVPNHVFAKISRPEVAERFLRPAPDGMLRELRERGVLDETQVKLATKVPIAEDITAEADSGGHTDRRPLVVLLPIVQRLRDRIAAEEGYDRIGRRPRVGAAGGIATPAGVWAAFAMGADYVMTGSINQAALEAGTSRLVKEMLAEASFTDVTSGPAPDMFELGAQVQVLGRGTMYAQRAQRLHELYKAYGSLDELPPAERQRVEKQILRRPIADVWAETESYWASRDPRVLERAAQDPRHKMALVFRWYLGMTSRWARIGEEDRRRDYQIWCGPAMGGFNEWVADSTLAPLEGRSVARIARALMQGAAAHARVAQARTLGLPVPPDSDGVPVLA